MLLILLVAMGASPATPAPPTAAPDIIPCKNAPEGMACIPGGPFLRGADKGPNNSRPQAEVWLQTFYMDRYEVTVAQYDSCVQAGQCDKAHTAYNDYSRPRQPKVGLNWYHARKFCQAHGKRLPSEAQWEKAARGSDGRLYPWGNSVATCKEAVIMDERGRSCGVKKRGSHPDKGRTLEVGTRQANQFGLYDMAGNSWEWVNDWYTPSYSRCGDACGGIDPLGPCNGSDSCPGFEERIVRGGSWYWPASHATTTFRRPHFPKNKPYHHFGFRCAATVLEAAALAP